MQIRQNSSKFVKNFIGDVAVVLFSGFQAAPPLPPATSRSSAEASTSYYGSIKRMVTDGSYMLLLVTYGLNVGVFYAMSTLLNQVVLSYFPV